jgi:hypothetical protein
MSYVLGEGEGQRETYCKVNSKKLSHQLSMVRKIKEKRLSLGYWK